MGTEVSDPRTARDRLLYHCPSTSIHLLSAPVQHVRRIKRAAKVWRVTSAVLGKRNMVRAFFLADIISKQRAEILNFSFFSSIKLIHPSFEEYTG